VIPKPPFAWELTETEERAAFKELQASLRGFWSSQFPRDTEPYTSVVVPSLTLDSTELAKIPGAPFLEERLLFLLIRLRNPHARLVYVTSHPVHPMVVEYYLQLLVGVPASHARSRLALLSAYDASSKPLTQKILERPRLIERIRASIANPQRAYLTTINSTPLERRLAVLLGIPLNGADPDLVHLGTKSGSRRIFREAGLDMAAGAEDVRSESDVLHELRALRAIRPGLSRALIKLDSSVSGEGNALVTLPAADPVGLECLERLAFAAESETRDAYFAKLARMGGVVEEMLEGNEVTSPSVQVRINPMGKVLFVSTHEQLLGGPTGQNYTGCRFPALDDYRMRLRDAGMKVGEALARHGVIGRFSVDFLARRLGGAWDVKALEINLRMAGTTHAMFALRFLTGGAVSEETGLYLTEAGQPRFYRATDALESPSYAGLLPEDLIEILTVRRLGFDHGTYTGVLFHMMGGISQFGRVGMVAIGESRDDAERLYDAAISILDAETRYPASLTAG
jgi:hypothetical protein